MSTEEFAQTVGSALTGGTTSYQIEITMSQQTLQTLQSTGSTLYGFKAIETLGGIQAPSHRAPLVWLASNNYTTDTAVTWMNQYLGYMSVSPLGPGSQVKMRSMAEVTTGEVMEIQQGEIRTMREGGGVPGEIEIINRTSSTYTTGIAEAVNGVTAPYCAFSLPDQKACHLRPVPRVLLMFASTPMGIGTVTTQAPSNGVLIDMSSASQRRVSFDAGTGWSWEGSSRVWPVPSNADLVRLLTEPGPDEGA